MAEVRLLAPNAIVGYGFPAESLSRGMARRPHAIVVDAGSTDPGPYYLGSGQCLNSRVAMKRDLRLMLNAAVPAGIPLIVSSCGGAGNRLQLHAVAEIVREIARECGLRFKLALIDSEQSKEDVEAWLREGRLTPAQYVPDLQPEAVRRTGRIVAMMGPEPFAHALDKGAQVILAGRASDPAPFAAVAMRGQCPPAQSWYAGKMLECGAAAATPAGNDSLFATVTEEGVEIEPTNPERRCTPLSVANFSLHENASPNIHVEPGGVLDTSECRIEAVSDRAVRVSGMTWAERPYSVKLEGAELMGYRALAFCATRDPVLTPQIDDYLRSVRASVQAVASELGYSPDKYQLLFRVYGRSGVMGDREPLRDARPHEIAIVVEVLAGTQDDANAILSVARLHTLHSEFPGRLCKEGNMAIPFSPADIAAGPAYRFSVFHILQEPDPLARFAFTYEDI